MGRATNVRSVFLPGSHMLLELFTCRLCYLLSKKILKRRVWTPVLGGTIGGI